MANIQKIILIAFCLLIASCGARTQSASVDDHSPIDTVRQYYPGGSVKSIELLKGGKKNGICTYYFPNGTLAASFHYVNDIKKGAFKTYFENGILRSEGVMLNDTALDGVFKIYDFHGNPLQKIIYSKGKPPKVKVY